MALQIGTKLRQLKGVKLALSTREAVKTQNQFGCAQQQFSSRSRPSWASMQVRKYSRKSPPRKPSPNAPLIVSVDEKEDVSKDTPAELANETGAVPEKSAEVPKTSEKVETDNSAATSAESTETLASKPKQRLPVLSRISAFGNGRTTSEARQEGDEKGKSLAQRFLSFGQSIPTNTYLLITPNMNSMLSVPAQLTIDPVSYAHVSKLTTLAKTNSGISLIYSYPIPYVDENGEQKYGYFGMYCAVTAFTKHKTLPRCELTLFPIYRIKVKDGSTPKSFSKGDIELWNSVPMDPADVDDIIVATLPYLSAPVSTLYQPHSSDPLLAEMTLHSALSNILDNVGRHDPSNVRQLVEKAFIEKRLDAKLDLVQRAAGLTTITYELSQSIEDQNDKRKLLGVEQQMEKMLRQHLADPKVDPELKLATQVSQLPEKIRPNAQKELDHLKTLDTGGSEYAVLSSYLDWLVHIPWNQRTTDHFDMKEAKNIMDRSHYGLDDVKIKILQLMANASRTGKMSAKPLLFVGPPGTGKTSFAKSIAEALGRKFISLAGLTETHDLRGHRRTYAGSIPGKIASEMRRCGAKNPVIVIDEIDKIEDTQRLRPLTPALLELLSPDQNKSFYDQYLDAGIDCSEVLFICTANSQEAISSPLLNRLHVVELRAYSPSEKFDIAKQYVLPKTLEESGLKNVSFTDEAITYLVQIYSKYEAGVRQITRHVQHIIRQLAVKAVNSNQGTDFKFQVTKDEMLKLLDAPDQVRGDRVYDDAIVGVVNGLSKNLYGGSTLTIEAIADKHKAGTPKPKTDNDDGASSDADESRRGVHFTGNIMETMKESSSIAYTYAKSFLARYFPENDFFKSASLHVHVPFGQIKKDGPSAGCALVCAYLSVAFNRPLATTLCMTGEITLSGRVTAVGGIREKVTAAAQNGMTDVILPLANKADFTAIPKDLVSSITPHFVSTFEEAFAVAFKMQLPVHKETKVTSQPLVSKRKIIANPSTPASKPQTLPNKLPKQPIVPTIEEKRSKIPISAVPSL